MSMFMEVCFDDDDENSLYRSIGCLECSLDCGNQSSRCLKTKIPHLPEICACSDGTFSNSTCPVVEQEKENVTAINIHGRKNDFRPRIFNIVVFFCSIARRLVAVCEHSFCGNDGVCIIIDSTFGCICPDGGIADRCTTNINTGLSKWIDERRDERRKIEFF